MLCALFGRLWWIGQWQRDQNDRTNEYPGTNGVRTNTNQFQFCLESSSGDPNHFSLILNNTIRHRGKR